MRRWMTPEKNASRRSRTIPRFRGSRSISTSSISFPKPRRRCSRKSGKAGGRFASFPLSRDEAVLTAASSARSPGFFGDSIRFRTNESVVNELLLLKARARKEKGQMAVFFIDDNFAINVKRTKSLLRDIIAAGAQVHWVAQISANLLRDEELIDLIAASGGKWIFIGMESARPRESERREQRLQQAGGIRRRAATAGQAQRLCHHFLHFWHG